MKKVNDHTYQQGELLLSSDGVWAEGQFCLGQRGYRNDNGMEGKGVKVRNQAIIYSSENFDL